MSHAAMIDELANELDTWPGVHLQRRSDGAVAVRYEHSELGVLYRDRGIAVLPFLEAEQNQLVEQGDAEPAELATGDSGVSHAVHGPSDVTATLELFDRRYREVRGEEEPYSSQDPGYGEDEPYSSQDPGYGEDEPFGSPDPGYGEDEPFGSPDPAS